ncbi:unnamed protein product [Mytilus coruscus]|uniref:B box-type domain-containing protein n=1 Tax=Mytilus coruscus TaxID=42192 RepID=A0A6J8E909_MYTCO|nr:unnamed protein product [Mytilus coruscus]
MPCIAFDIVYFSEDNTLAVTSGNSKKQCITFIDVDWKQIKKTISIDSFVYGIAENEKRLIYSTYTNGIRMVNLHDESIHDIVGDKMPSKLQWTFQNASVLKYPHGIDVDNDGNEYVVGTDSRNVVVISPDGKRHIELLTASDGLKFPFSLHYSGQTNQLLVANFNHTAHLFNSGAECDEELCTECKEHHRLSKSSRSHSVVSFTDYLKLPADILRITQYCSKHDKKYQMYCQKHEFPSCSKCIVESHNECRDFVELNDVIHNVKTSNAMCEIEDTLVEVAENLQKIRQHQQDNLTTFKENGKEIEKEIKKTSIKINNHLDKLQEDLMKQLYAVEEQENSRVVVIIRKERKGNSRETL